MPGLIADALAAVGRAAEDWLELHPLDPLYRAHYSRRHRPWTCAATRTRWPTRSSGCAAPPKPRATALRALRLASCSTLEMHDFIDRNVDSPWDLPPQPRPAGGARRLPPAGAEGGPVPAGSTDPAGVLLPVDVRRPVALRRARALCRHRLHGLRRRASTSPAAACMPYRGRWPPRPSTHGATFRYGDGGHPGRDPRRPRGRRHTADGERIPSDAVVLNPDLPVAYRDCSRRRAPGRSAPLALDYARPASCCWPAPTATYPGPRTTPSTSATRGARSSPTSSTGGELMRDPSVLVTCPTPATRRWPPPDGRSTTCWPRRRTSTPAGLVGLRSALPRRGRRAARAPRLRRLRRGHRGRVDDDAADWRRAGWSAGHRSRPPTASARPDRSVRATCPGLENVVFVGSGTVPGVGVPMVLVQDGWPPSESQGPDIDLGTRRRHRVAGRC